MDDVGRDLVLNGEDVFHVTVVAFRPNVIAVRDVDELVKRADVRMIELRDRPGLTLEALFSLGAFGEVLGKYLDGDRPVEARVVGFVDLAHAARTDGLENFVWAKLGSGF